MKTGEERKEEKGQLYIYAAVSQRWNTEQKYKHEEIRKKRTQDERKRQKNKTNGGEKEGAILHIQSKKFKQVKVR